MKDILKIISLFLLFVYISYVFRVVLPLIDYAVNYKYISAELCEQKDVPNNSCQGTCHLSKQIGNQNNADPSTTKIVIIDFIKIPHQSVIQNTINAKITLITSDRISIKYSLINHLVKPLTPPPKIFC